MSKTKSPNPVDVYVGQRIRARRHQVDVTQQGLAKALGLTFQQVQKYEKGVNRVGSSRLQQIANVLKASPSYFFEGAPGSADENLGAEKETSFFALHGAAGLAEAYVQITDAEGRHCLVALARYLADRDQRESFARGAV